MMGAGKGMLVIGRADQLGLGSMTEDFCRAFKPEYLVIIDRGRPLVWNPSEVCDKGQVCMQEWFSRHWTFPQGVKTIVGFETFYRDDLPLKAQQQQTPVTTILFPMWEWTPPIQAERATWLAILSDTDRASYTHLARKCFFCRWPKSPAVHNENRIQTWPPKHFLHLAGNAKHNRDGTKEVLQAAKYLIGTDAKLLVRAHFEELKGWERDPAAPIEFLPSVDSRKDLLVGDILIQPRRLGGHSLPIDEAAGDGMPVLTLASPDWSSSATFMVPGVKQPNERFGRCNAPVMRADPDELGKYMREMALGNVALPCQLSTFLGGTWEMFVKDWLKVIEGRVTIIEPSLAPITADDLRLTDLADDPDKWSKELREIEKVVGTPELRQKLKDDQDARV